MITFRSIGLSLEMFHIKVVEKIKTFISCWKLFFSENRAAYEVMWKNVVQPDRPYGACALHAGNLSVQTHTKNM